MASINSTVVDCSFFFFLQNGYSNSRADLNKKKEQVKIYTGCRLCKQQQKCCVQYLCARNMENNI